MQASEFIKRLTDDQLVQIMQDYVVYNDQGFLGDCYTWGVAEEFMGLLEIPNATVIDRSFWARVLHAEVCKSLAWRWINDYIGEKNG